MYTCNYVYIYIYIYICLDSVEIHQFQCNPQHKLSKNLGLKERTNRVQLLYNKVFATSLCRFPQHIRNTSQKGSLEYPIRSVQSDSPHRQCTQSLCSNQACLWQRWQRIPLYNVEVRSCPSQFVCQQNLNDTVYSSTHA